MTRFAILCSHCQLFLKDEKETVCEAYPKGIPVSFTKGERVCKKIVPIESSKGIVRKIFGDK